MEQYGYVPKTPLWANKAISALEKCKSKLPWGITSHRSEWPSSKNLQTINAGEGVEKSKPSYTVGGNVNWCSHYGKRSFLKKLKTELPNNPAIPLLGIYSDKTIIQKDTCTPMITEKLLTRVITYYFYSFVKLNSVIWIHIQPTLCPFIS